MSTYPNIIAAKDARIAELEAEVERLTKNLYLTRNERDNLSDNVTRLESEALSRTGAVKVKALDWEAREERRLGATTEKFWRAQTAFDWGYRVKAYGKGFSFDDATGYPTIDAAKAAAQADYERRILSALEPAAPEGQQPVAHVIRKGFSSGVLGWTGYGQKADLPDGTMLYTRPTERAVTEAGIAKAEAIDMLLKADDVWADYGSGFRVHFSFPPKGDSKVVERINTARALAQEGK